MIIGNHAYIFTAWRKNLTVIDKFPRLWKIIDSTVGEDLDCRIWAMPVDAMTAQDQKWHERYGEIPDEWNRKLIVPGVPSGLVTPTVCPKCGETIMEPPEMKDERQPELI